MKNTKVRVKAFTLIDTIIATIGYSILILWVLTLYNMYTNYKIAGKYRNKDIYIKQFIENSDKLVCYKWRQNKTDTDSEKNICDNFENNPSIKFFVTTLINLRDRKFYKTLFIKKDWNTNYLGLTTDTTTDINKRISNIIQKYRVFTGENGFLNLSLRQKWSPFNLNLILIDSNFLK